MDWKNQSDSHLKEDKTIRDRGLLEFRQILEYCSNVHSPYWELAWKELHSRYHNFICQKVRERCLSWNISRLSRQVSTTVDDIVAEVYLNLCKDDCRNLRQFRGRDNERIFLGWLKKICANVTNVTIRKYFKKWLVDDEESFEVIKNYMSGLGVEQRWELYEDLVKFLRAKGGSQKKNRERDINIFFLYVWSDFNTEMIKFHPFLGKLGHRVVDNVVGRIRNEFRNYNSVN